MILTADGQPASVLSSHRLLASAREQDFREGYRDLGGHPLLWIPQDDLIRRAYWAYMASPLGGGMIDKATNVIVGKGFAFHADAPQIQDELDRFWDHPYHDFAWHQDRHVAELALFGEKCFTLAMNPYSQDVTVAEVHPYAIERTIVDKQNSALVAGVKLKSTSRTPQILKTAVPAGFQEEDLFCEATRDLRQTFHVDGEAQECMFFAINERTVVQSDGYDEYGPDLRGTTDLVAALDWIFAVDDFLTSMIKRAAIASKLIYDVACEDMDEAAIKKYIENTKIPTEYTVNAHSNKLQWSFLTPDLKASEHETSFRMIRNFAISGKGGGYPGHWFGDGGEVNRSTAAEMYFPTIMQMERRQWKMSRIFRRLVAYQLERKGLPFSRNDIGVEVSKIQDTEHQQQLQLLKDIANALIVGEDRAWASQDEARLAFRAALKTLMKDLGHDLQEQAIPTPDESGAQYVSEDYAKK